MKTLKLITTIALTVILAFTSCQSEENEQVGTNPNTNSSNSPTAKNYERVSQNDGSKDDFLDSNSCTELLFPLTATVNGQQITLVSSLDYSQVLEIMGQFNDDEDRVTFTFPISARLSNYTEVIINNQLELDALKEECNTTTNAGNNAISCIEIDFPITVLTYDLRFEQTGRAVLQSEQQLYTFMNNLESDELFSVNYPINASLSNGTTVQLNSDVEFQDAISECVQYEGQEDAAEENADEVESIVSQSKFKVESFISAGIETANDYANYTIDFTNDLKLIARDTVNITTSNIEGTYSVSSELDVFLNITFAGNTALSALNNDWIVTTYSNTLIQLQSKTDAAVTLKFRKI